MFVCSYTHIHTHILSLSLLWQGESTRLGGISLLSGSHDTSGESAFGISARLAGAAGGGPTDLNETESENFSAYQGCPNAATRINTHGDRWPPLTFKRTTTGTHRGGEVKKDRRGNAEEAADDDEEEEDDENDEEDEGRERDEETFDSNGGGGTGERERGAAASVVHRFPDLAKKKPRSTDCCSGLLATFSKNKRKIRIERKRERKKEEKNDYDDDDEDCTRVLRLVFRASVHDARE